MFAALQLINSLSLSLAMVLAFSSWVLAAISIRWIHTVFASYYKPDPATIVAGLLLWAYLLSIIVFRSFKSSYLKTKTVITVTSCLGLFVFAMSIVYSAMRHKSYYNCALATNTPTGNTFYACAGLNKALQAVTYSCWILTFAYVGTLYALAKKHGTHEWTRGESGLDTPVGYLNPAQPKNSGPEFK